MDERELLAPKPSSARLTIIKAKRYHWATEKTLVSVISKSNVAADSIRIPMHISSILGFLMQ